MITVLIVDDHPVVRSGLQALLAGEPTLTVVGSAASGEEALTLVAAMNPDVVLCDLRLSDGMDGVAYTVGYVFGFGVLEEVAGRSGHDRADDVGVVVVGCQDEHGRPVAASA